MARIFITGSSGGIGLETGRQLVAKGHEVVLHARSEARAEDARVALPEAQAVAVADIETLAGMRSLAGQIETLGPFDAVIHNAGVFGGKDREVTEDGFETTFAVNVIAPYLMSVLSPRAERLVYLSSSMHRSGRGDLADPQWESRPWDATQAYCDSKLYLTMLAMALGERWPGSAVTAVDPGWIATRMGGASAPGTVEQGADTQVWIASGEAQIKGGYYLNRRREDPASPTLDRERQDALLAYLASLTGGPILG